MEAQQAQVPPKPKEWLIPLNKILLRNAFSNREKNVTFRDGSQFVIEYDGLPDRAWVRPINRWMFVPCGWFRYKDIVKDGSWIGK